VIPKQFERLGEVTVHELPRRLHSWKEIAAYIGRDVRTAQRWEGEGMPVRRLQHDKLSSVFGDTAEIDAWLASRCSPPRPAPEQRDRVATVLAAPPSAIPIWRRRRVIAGVAIVLAALGASAAGFLSRPVVGDRTQMIDQASTLLLREQFAPAEDLLRRLVNRGADPLAETYLAWTLLSEGKPAAEYRMWAERAERHLGRATPEAEEYFVRGSRAHMFGDSETAVKWYRAGLVAAPGQYWIVNNLAHIYAERGWDSLMIDLVPRLVALSPGTGAAGDAATFLFQYGDFDAAMKYREMALADTTTNPDVRCWLRAMPAQIAWLKGDAAGAVRMAHETAARLDVWSWERDETRARLADVLLLVGQTADALGLIRTYAAADIRESRLAIIGALGGDGSSGPTVLKLPEHAFDADVAALVAALPASDSAGSLARTALAKAETPIGRELLQAEGLRYEKRWSEAIDHYQRAIARGPTVHAEDNQVRGGEPMVYVPVLWGGGSTALVLEAYLGAAESHAQAGQTDKAVRLLEKLAGFRTYALVAHLPGTASWIRGQRLLQQIQHASRH
jgi:tetratricopeptide (TPR) repeat protein